MNELIRKVMARRRASRGAGALLLLVVGLVSGSASTAQETDVDCDTAFTTVEMMACIGKDIEAAEAALRRTLAAEREALDEQGRSLLEASQIAWENFRDAECERARDVVRGGTMGPLIAGACLVDMTHARTRELSGAARVADDTETVFWREAPPLVGQFQCDGYVEARVGLIPKFEPDAGQLRWGRN